MEVSSFGEAAFQHPFGDALQERSGRDGSPVLR
jgi:hypothetical protein